MSLTAQCATYAYLSNGGNCISLSWFPQSILPAFLPGTINFNGSEYTLNQGLGDVGFPAVYKKSIDDCALPTMWPGEK